MENVEHGLVELLNEHEVAGILGISVATMRRWRLFKRGPEYLKLGGSVRYAPTDLQNWMASSKHGGQS